MEGFLKGKAVLVLIVLALLCTPAFGQMTAKDWFERGNALYIDSKYEEAILAYDKAIEIDPQSEPTWNNKGTALDKQGKYDEAIIAYNKAIEIDPKYLEAWNGKCIALDALGRTTEADAAFAKAKKLG
jgi:Flp pilus assembly protein TadD